MLKKTIAIMAVLLLVASGVASVSAYEAHIIDIKAHVENALGVPTEATFGTVFPEEVVEMSVKFGLSNSFVDKNQTRVSDLHYAMLWEPKPIEDGFIDPDGDGFFEPLAPWIVLSPIDANDGALPQVPPTWVPAWGIAWGELNKIIPEPAGGPAGDLCDDWHLTFDVPVFDKYYNPDTDPKVPSGFLVLADNDYVIVDETVCGQVVKVPHADLGSNLKIQVCQYSYH